MINGILNIKKEAGFTSHDVVAKLRGITKQKKIGHTGTLDPEATGVLPVCLGKATKVCRFLTDEKKTYEAVLLLGRETDTQDSLGRVLSEKPVGCTPEQAREVLESFLGDQMQVPPMYSALKKDGKKLYELARAGIEVERPPRPVHFFEIRVLEASLPRVRFRVTCSRGTYIRTLCHDAGARLLCGGCMESLVRTEVGPFKLEDAKTLDEIRVLQEAGRLSEVLMPVDRLFSDLPAVRTSPDGDAAAHNGNRLQRKQIVFAGQAGEEAEKLRIYDSEGVFIGIYRKEAEHAAYRPLQMFCENE